MRLHRRIRHRLKSLFRAGSANRELDEELREHLARLTESHRAAGLSPADARAAALREFGNVTLIQEDCVETRGVRWLGDLRRDLGYALRSMRRTPVYTAVAALSLALAIGANTAIFSAVNVLMLRDLPVENPGALVEVGRVTPYGRGSFSYPIYERLRDDNTVFEGLLTMSSGTTAARVPGSGNQASGRFVSGNFFELLGVRPAAGRLLAPGDDRPGSEATVVISHGLWQREFGGALDAVGQTLQIERATFTIVGVLPRAFRGLIVGQPDDFYVPMASEPQVRRSSWLGNRDFNWLSVVGRLAPGRTRDEAKTGLDVVFARFVEEFAESVSNPVEQQRIRSHRLTFESARAGLSAPRREFSTPVLVLMGAVGAVLLIACANVVNLLLARGIARRREVGLRLAIGASRGRLIRQLLTESATLGMLGGAAGFALAVWLTHVIGRLMSEGSPGTDFDVSPDGRVLLFTAAISLTSALVAGLGPALRTARTSAGWTGRDDARMLHASRATKLWTGGLIAAQVALSLLLVTGATLLATSLRTLHTFDAGFDRSNLLLTGLNPGRAGYAGERRLAYYRAALERARTTPAVQAAGLAMITPISGGGVDLSLDVEGQPRSGSMVYVNRVSDGLFGAMGTALLLGRDFSAADVPDTPPVAIVNDALRRRYFKDENPIGRRVVLGRGQPLEVVGVVANAKYLSLREDDQPTIYLCAFQDVNVGGLTLVARIAGDPIALEPALRAALRAAGGDVPVGQASTMTAQIDRSLVRERLMTRILTAFALLALLLAAVGLYAVLGYAVSRRTSEIGLRLALGASRGAVMRTVLREALTLVAIGIAVGIPASMWVTRLLSSLLYGIAPGDPYVLAGATAALTVTALLAASAPAHRALRVDPLAALRSE